MHNLKNKVNAKLSLTKIRKTDVIVAEPLDSDSIVNRWVDESPRAQFIDRVRLQKEYEEKARLRISAENRKKRRKALAGVAVEEMDNEKNSN